jgi:ubiquinone biosynthesis protein
MLAPNVNMWEMARPLIEAWMTLHLGPMGVARQVGGDLKASLHKLPGLINRLDTAASAMEERGLKLHPDTLAALQGGRRSFGRKDPKQGIMQLLPWVLVAILVVALLQK